MIFTTVETLPQFQQLQNFGRCFGYQNWAAATTLSGGERSDKVGQGNYRSERRAARLYA